MAATKTVPHLAQSHNSLIARHGVVTLFGYGIRVQVNAGHLLLHDGIADERRTIRLSRVNHGLKRLVMIGSDGFITLEALRWISDVGAAFLMLDRRGKVLVVTGPVSSSDARLRRAQALALGNGTALKISKELIFQKLDGQAALVREMLRDSATWLQGRRRKKPPSNPTATTTSRPFVRRTIKNPWIDGWRHR